MKTENIYIKQLGNLMNHLHVPWMLLDTKRSSPKKSPGLVVVDLHPKLANILGMRKSNMLNQPVQQLFSLAKTENQKIFFGQILKINTSTFSFSKEEHHYKIKKHTLSNYQLLTLVSSSAGLTVYPLIEKKFRSIFNALGDFVFITGFNGKFLEVNDTALHILAYSRGDFLKLTPREISVSKNIAPSEPAASAFDQYDEWVQSEQLLFGSELVTKEGKRIPIEARSKIINYDGNDAILTIARDITERMMFEKRLINIVMETEEKERRRLSEELHDGLGPLLSSVKMHTDMLINDELDAQKKEEVARLIKELVIESINNIREISANLMPHVLSNYGLVSALKTLISKITALQEINVEFNHSKWIIRPELSIEVLIYRVISELLTNTLKHASARNISLSLASHPAFLEIIYTDDGIGFDSGLKFKQSTGMGLNNILNRIKSQQGSVVLKTSTGKGLKVHLKLPLDS